MFKDLHKFQYACNYCHGPFENNTPVECTGWGEFHSECKDKGIEQTKEEYHKVEQEYYEEMKREHVRDQRVLKRLRKRLPHKIMEWVDGEIREHGCGGYKVVTVEQCKGDRMRGKDYFNDNRCPIRTVYDDISGGGYPCEDCYSGDIYIYIGNGQYFKMWVNG